MLLRFGIQNHLSLRDKQELSLVASSLKDVDAGILHYTGIEGGKVLPVAIIYGANASGKSNLLAGLKWMRNAVLFSHSRGEPNGGVTRSPFALDEESSKSSSSFDVDFIIDTVRYHYGFTASNASFTSEWLYSFPEGKKQKLFERKEQIFAFGRSLKGRNKIISELTRSNSLFLAAAAQNHHEQLLKISAFFRSINFEYTTISKENIDPRIINFLGKIGTGVVGYRTQEAEWSKDNVLLNDFRKSLLALVSNPGKGEEIPEAIASLSDDKIKTIELAHRTSNGNMVYFGLSRESSGTQRLLDLLANVFQSLDNGTLLLVDELEASIHAQISCAIVELFSSPLTNPKQAQLIATTHDTNLLRSAYLRRDQIWFTEKEETGATNLYPLTAINTRQGDNIEKGYLQGRYGAIPFAGSAVDLWRAR